MSLKMLCGAAEVAISMKKMSYYESMNLQEHAGGTSPQPHDF